MSWRTLSKGLLIFVSGCQPRGTTHPTAAAHAWSYQGESGPDAWADLENTECDGRRQSPVNIVEIDTSVLEPTDFDQDSTEIHYAADTMIESVTNNGHTIQYNFEVGDNYAVSEGERYDLLQVHFHAPAEHTINGIRHPLEMHFVHGSEAGNFLVYAVMAAQGEPSPEFAFLTRFLPVRPGETRAVGESHAFDEEFGVDDDETFFYYEGSLTTPPCSERVSWIVFRESMTLGVEQIELLQELMPIDNYRDAQPLHGRTVYKGDSADAVSAEQTPAG